MYLLLLGTTALSLVFFLMLLSPKMVGYSFGFKFLTLNYDTIPLQVTTPVLFKLIPAVMHLGVLMHWFPAETTQQSPEVSLSIRLSVSGLVGWLHFSLFVFFTIAFVCNRR